jgi:hypothetical protein
LDSLDGLLSGALPWALHGVASALDSASRFSVVSDAVSPLWRHLIVMSPLMTLLALVVAVTSRSVTGHLADSLRTLLAQLVLVAMGLAMTPGVSRLVGTGVDGLSQWVLSMNSGSLSLLGSGVLALLSPLSGSGALFSTVLLVVGALSLWVEIIIRDLALALALCVIPLLAPWVVTTMGRRALVRLVELIAALLFAKVLTALTLAVGLQLALHSSSLTAALAGAVTLGVASLAPWVLWRLIPMVDASAHHLASTWRAHAARQLTNPEATLMGVGRRALAPRMDMSGEADESDSITPWPGITVDEPVRGTDPGPAPIGKARAHKGRYRFDADGKPRWHIEE